MLEVMGLTRRFGGVTAVEDVSFEVPAGQWLGIIGPNGAGKSTLFNLLGGQLAPSSGRVVLEGREITQTASHDRFRLGIGRSFQIASLFPTLSVHQQLVLALRRRGRWNVIRDALSGTRLRADLARTLSQWDLDHVGPDTRPDELSYGEQRRLELALAIASGPRLLLLDEPNVGLTADECRELLERVRAIAADVTVIFVAHDMDMVLGWSDRILVMHFGRLVADESPDRLLHNDIVSDIYLGDAS